MKENKTKNIIIITLFIVIILLIIAVIYLGLKNEFLEEKYEYLNENKYNNSEVNNNSNNNNSENVENNSTQNISRDEALDIALKDLKVDKNNIRDLDIELEYKVRYGKTIYEVSFDYNYFEYEYYIDATDGTIFKSFSERN